MRPRLKFIHPGLHENEPNVHIETFSGKLNATQDPLKITTSRPVSI